jgi:nucleotide-binding universal stress UspA family protein
VNEELQRVILRYKRPPEIRRKQMKVLVPTEGSEFSQAAIKKCCEMFDESVNTEIRILSVVEPTPTFPPADAFSVSIDDYRKLEEAAMKKAKDIVSQAETEIRSGFPDLAVGLTTKVVKGSPKESIVEEAENWDADLIIMGSHGYGFWNRAVLGPFRMLSPVKHRVR